MRGYIYGGIDVDTREMRYVGQSINFDKRVRRHELMALAHRDEWPIHRWIRKRFAEDRAIAWVIIEQLEDNDPRSLDELEIGWITYFRAIGCRLKNCTDGGSGFREFERTEQHKARISAAMTKVCSTPEARERLKFWKGKPRSAETKAKLSASLRGRKLPGRPKKR